MKIYGWHKVPHHLGPTDLDLLLCNYKADINVNVYKGPLTHTLINSSQECVMGEYMKLCLSSLCFI